MKDSYRRIHLIGECEKLLLEIKKIVECQMGPIFWRANWTLKKGGYCSEPYTLGQNLESGFGDPTMEALIGFA